jgi:hypothetical protein
MEGKRETARYFIFNEQAIANNENFARRPTIKVSRSNFFINVSGNQRESARPSPR